LAESGTLTAQLVAATETNEKSLLPADLNTTNNILSTVITALENSSTHALQNDVLYRLLLQIYSNMYSCAT